MDAGTRTRYTARPQEPVGSASSCGRPTHIGWAARWIVALCVAALALAALGTAAFASTRAAKPPINLAGTWSGTYSGGFSGSFTLKWTQTNSKLRRGTGLLKGTIKLSNPGGVYRISGSVNGTTIKFGAVGVGAVYAGSVSSSGISMSGTWKSGVAKGSWKAHRLLSPSKSKVTLG